MGAFGIRKKTVKYMEEVIGLIASFQWQYKDELDVIFLIHHICFV